jgi:hypothetical protein
MYHTAPRGGNAVPHAELHCKDQSFAQDARQIAENVAGSFRLLVEWSRAEVPFPVNDTGKPVAPDNEEVRHGR